MNSTSEDEGLSSPDEQALLSEMSSPFVTSGSEYEEIGLLSDTTATVEDEIPKVHKSHTTLESNEDVYSEVQKSPKKANDIVTNGVTDDKVPAGWRKCSDEDGDYYWQVRTGRIQRDRPPELPGELELCSPDDHLRSMENHLLNLTDQTIRSISLNDEEPSTVLPEQPLRFCVHSIGWSPVVESDLHDQETSCRAINRCIIDLTSGRSNEGMGQWAEGKELCMEIDGREMCLVDPVSTTVLSVQPIHTIRVWGVGSQNTCDFAYVARDPSTRIYKCHVFRCDVPAKQIANTLKEICGRLAKERKLRNNTSEQDSSDAQSIIQQRSKALLPSPMDGPSKTKKCHYLGSEPVHKATGMDVLNGVIEKMANKTDRCDWTLVNMTVSPTFIRASDVKDYSAVKLDCRLRFLSFFGISVHDVRLMGLIVHTSEDEFEAHIFHCEPSAGGICKILEAACKLRYQKQLDSMPADQLPREESAPTVNKTITETVRNMFSRVWSGKKS